MRTRILVAFILLAACTPRPVELDDEAESTSESTSESSSDSTSTNADASESDHAEGFVPANDALPVDECDMIEQDCRSGEKCVPYASSEGGYLDATKCVPVMGDQPTGEPCWSGGSVEATDDCDESSFCWNGICHAFCQGSADAPVCPPLSDCFIPGSGVPALCIPNCDPIVQDCGEGRGCYWANTGFNCIHVSGGIATGEPCGYINDCAPGNLCINADMLPSCSGDACCTTFCDLQLGDAGCANQPGTVCVGFPDEPKPGFEYVGACMLR